LGRVFVSEEEVVGIPTTHLWAPLRDLSLAIDDRTVSHDDFFLEDSVRAGNEGRWERRSAPGDMRSCSRQAISICPPGWSTREDSEIMLVRSAFDEVDRGKRKMTAVKKDEGNGREERDVDVVVKGWRFDGRLECGEEVVDVQRL